MKLGLFGGTFNPIHFGHLRAAQELAELLKLDRIFFIPAATPPHKETGGIVSFEHRLQMLQLAVAGNDSFSISHVENLRPGKSYSIDTVRHFQKDGDSKLECFFITGQDAFDAITTWHDWKNLLRLCRFVVMTRPGYENRGLHQILPPDVAGRYIYDAGGNVFQDQEGGTILFRRTTFLDISSSEVRKRIQQGRSVRYLTPDSVIRYMEANRLYQ
ncbi:MAG: nicotinate-nucleotide adenylyltransferase [Smithellaceae bacterium]|jgi:nicotinate-nucleotide adenylyltransferase|nr:nicotinate-nucleotide adenylyltransferase [Smithellaceae bacterium]